MIRSKQWNMTLYYCSINQIPDVGLNRITRCKVTSSPRNADSRKPHTSSEKHSQSNHGDSNHRDNLPKSHWEITDGDQKERKQAI